MELQCEQLNNWSHTRGNRSVQADIEDALLRSTIIRSLSALTLSYLTRDYLILSACPSSPLLFIVAQGVDWSLLYLYRTLTSLLREALRK